MARLFFNIFSFIYVFSSATYDIFEIGSGLQLLCAALIQEIDE